MWLCAFKQAGNYILPYSYSALHGCALGLLSLALLVGFIERRREADPAGNGLDGGSLPDQQAIGDKAERSDVDGSLGRRLTGSNPAHQEVVISLQRGYIAMERGPGCLSRLLQRKDRV